MLPLSAHTLFDCGSARGHPWNKHGKILIAMTSAQSSPVFIVSPTPRSGTNFLMHALVAVGFCEPPSRRVLTREDHLLKTSGLLTQYVEETAKIWSLWEKDAATLNSSSDELLAAIGSGILRFIGGPTDSSKRVVIKTPTSASLHNFPRLFPSCRVILLVRDGRDTTESQVQSWQHVPYASAFAQWAQGARELLEFSSNCRRGRGVSWVLIRYEHLLTDTAAVLKSIGSFLDIHTDHLDLEAVARLPVYGSSEIGKKIGSRFEWCVEAKPQGFNPIGRWRNWPLERRELFKRLAGKELIDLGYEGAEAW